MKHFKHKLLFALLAVFSFTCQMQAQVTIGDDAPPRLGTVLDLKQTNPAGTMGGLLLPTVNITDVELIPDDFIGYKTASVGVRDQVLELAGTLVYNANTTTGEGIYYWNGNKWRKVNATGQRNPANIGVGTGVLTGKSCFDIAKGNDKDNGCAGIISRIPQSTDFTLITPQDPAAGSVLAPYSGTQVYTFTPSGAVSKVRFDYVDASGKVVESITPNADYSGNNISTPCKVTVVYKHTLNDDLLNKPRAQALELDLYAIYNMNVNGAGGATAERAVKLTATLADCACCGAYTAGGQWITFMCYNLGADENLDPFTPAKGLHGNYYQWGRNAVVANADTSVAAISGWDTAYAPNGAWSDASTTTNDPCPAGFRVPRKTDWDGVLAQTALNPQTPIGTWTSSATNFTTGRKIGQGMFLPAAGYRDLSNGQLLYRGHYGYYWSTTELTSSTAYTAIVQSTVSNMSTPQRTSGFSVRCVSE